MTVAVKQQISAESILLLYHQTLLYKKLPATIKQALYRPTLLMRFGLLILKVMPYRIAGSGIASFLLSITGGVVCWL
jgi:hypothetical protein